MTTQTQVLRTEEALSVYDTLKLALEALETAWYHVFCPTDKAIELYDDARAAIKAALEAHKALMSVSDVAQSEQVGINGLTEAETNATASVFGLVNAAPPYVATPRQRPSRSDMTWVGLTHEDIDKAIEDNQRFGGFRKVGFAYDLELVLKEKNTK
jgi:hypothetical protein